MEAFFLIVFFLAFWFITNWIEPWNSHHHRD